MNMQKKFLKYCESIGLKSEVKILLAVSGGLDSMALFHLFRLSGFSRQVAHCKFKLRCEESDGDEVFVKVCPTATPIFFVPKSNASICISFNRRSSNHELSLKSYSPFAFLHQKD